MTWLWKGSKAVVTLTDGSAVRGTIGWSWRWGWLRLDDVEELTDAGTRRAPGKVFIPSHSILIAQVI